VESEAALALLLRVLDAAMDEAALLALLESVSSPPSLAYSLPSSIPFSDSIRTDLVYDDLATKTL
jgi:hypothetical protein